VKCFSGKKSDGGMQAVVRAATLRPLHCVWAKCRGFPWYPGMVRFICFVWCLCDMWSLDVGLRQNLCTDIDNLLLQYIEHNRNTDSCGGFLSAVRDGQFHEFFPTEIFIDSLVESCM